MPTPDGTAQLWNDSVSGLKLDLSDRHIGKELCSPWGEAW